MPHHLKLSTDVLAFFDHSTLPDYNDADLHHELDVELRDRIDLLMKITPSRPAWRDLPWYLDPLVKTALGDLGGAAKENRKAYVEAFVKRCKKNLRQTQQLWRNDKLSWQAVCSDFNYPPPLDIVSAVDPSTDLSPRDSTDVAEPAQEDSSTATRFLGTFELDPFKIPNSLDDSKQLIVQRVEQVLDWNQAYMSSPLERSSTMADVRKMIDYMFKEADPTLEQARALYAAPYSSDPVAVVRRLPFYHAEWDDLGAIGYIKSVPVKENDLAALAASDNSRTSTRAAFIAQHLFDSPSPALVDVLESAGVSVSALTPSLSHGGLTQTGMAKRLASDQGGHAVTRPSLWLACVHLAALACDPPLFGQQGLRLAPIAHAALVDPYCGGSPPADERVRLISLGEHVAASFSAGFTNTNIAVLGLREATSLPPPASILPPVALGDFNNVRASLDADKPFTLAMLHQQPGVRSTSDDLLTVPVVRFLDRVLEYVLGRPIHSYLSAEAAAAARADSTGLTVVHLDACITPKEFGVDYKKAIDPAVVIEQVEQRLLRGRENPSSPIILVVCTGVADAGLHVLADPRATTTLGSFRDGMYGGTLAFAPHSLQYNAHAEQTMVMCCAIQCAAAFTYLNSPHLTAACIAGLAGSMMAGSQVAVFLNTSRAQELPVKERVDGVRDIVKTAASRTGGLLPLARARHEMVRLLENAPETDLSLGRIEQGLRRDGLRVSSGDVETLVELVGLGYSGKGGLHEHFKRTRDQPVGASSRLALTSIEQPFTLALSSTRLKNSAYAFPACIICALIEDDGVVRARALGEMTRSASNATTSRLEMHVRIAVPARQWILDNLERDGWCHVRFHFVYSTANRAVRTVLIGSADESLRAPSELAFLDLVDTSEAALRLLVPGHRRLELLWPPERRMSRPEHTELLNRGARIVVTHMMATGVNTTILADMLAREMAEVDIRWTYQNVYNWIQNYFVKGRALENRVDLWMSEPSQAALDENEALKAKAAALRDRVRRMEEAVDELYKLGRTRDDLKKAVVHLEQVTACIETEERGAGATMETDE